MEAFLTSTGSVVTNVGTQFATLSGSLIENEVVVLAVGMIIFAYLIRKTIKLVCLAKRA